MFNRKFITFNSVLTIAETLGLIMKYLLTITILLTFNIVFSQTMLDFSVMNNCSENKVEEYGISLSSLDFDKEIKDYWIDKDSLVTIEKGIYLIFISIVEGDYVKSYSVTRAVSYTHLTLPTILLV